MNSNVSHIQSASGPPQVDERLADDLDAGLIRSAMDGDTAAYEQLVNRYYPRVLNFLSARLPNRADAEDVAQQTFIKAWRNVHRFDCSYRFSPWLYTIAARLAVSHHRKRKRDRFFDQADEKIVQESPKPFIESDGKKRIWSIARTELKPLQFQILWLYYHEELSVKETAAALNKSTVHAKVMLYRARAALGKRLAHAGVSMTSGL